MMNFVIWMWNVLVSLILIGMIVVACLFVFLCAGAAFVAAREWWHERREERRNRQ